MLVLLLNPACIVAAHVTLVAIQFADVLSQAGQALALLGPIDESINKAVEGLRSAGRPVAILGVVLLALSWLAAGILPDWAQQNKGVLVKMFMGGVLLGIAPDIVGVFLPGA